MVNLQTTQLPSPTSVVRWKDGNAGSIVLVGGKGILYPLNEILYPVNGGSYWFGVEFGDPLEFFRFNKKEGRRK